MRYIIAVQVTVAVGMCNDDVAQAVDDGVRRTVERILGRGDLEDGVLSRVLTPGPVHVSTRYDAVEEPSPLEVTQVSPPPSGPEVVP